MRRVLLALALAFGAASCGGGNGGNGGGGPPGAIATLVSSGLAALSGLQGCATIDPFLYVPVSEAQMGQDLNGDGDTLDSVAHVVDVLADTARNLGLAVIGGAFAEGSRFLFLVSEAGQGGIDLSGDGDATDGVWFLFNPSLGVGPGNPLSLTVASSPLAPAAAATSGGFVFTESEAATGFDRNGDGDLADETIVTLDTTTLAPVRSVFARFPGAPYVARNGRVLFVLSEAGNALDMNGDGDRNDLVLVCVDFTAAGTGAVRPVGAAGRARSIASFPYALTDGAAVYFVDEASEASTDINLDGDKTDAVIAVFDFAGASGEFRPVTPLLAQLGVSGAPPFGIAVSAGRAVVGVPETGQGALGRDMNGDGDTGDVVAGWIDTLNAPSILEVIGIALAPVPIALDGTRGIATAAENGAGSAGVDFNGDGDTTDTVAMLLDVGASPGSASTLGFACAGAQISGVDAIVRVPEAQQAGLDLSGDGDQGDLVPFYFDLGDSPPTHFSFAAPASALAFVRHASNSVRIASVVPEGQAANFQDMNGDGDLLDVSLVLFGANPTLLPPSASPGTPRVMGVASTFVQAPLRLGTRVFVFPTSETMANADLNGDADKGDTVLRYVRYPD